MPWYAAHIVMQLDPIDASYDKALTAWENIVLFEAGSREEAGRAAVEYGRNEERLGGGLTVDGLPARERFVGVRKVVDCVDSDRRPGGGTEVSYLEMLFTSREKAEAFVSDERIPVDLGGGL